MAETESERFDAGRRGEPATMKIVATRDSIKGGPCDACRNHIRAGQPVYKLPGENPNWKGQGGQGYWVCGDCAYKATRTVVQ